MQETYNARTSSGWDRKAEVNIAFLIRYGQHSDKTYSECARNGVQAAAVVEQRELSRLPVDDVDVLRSDAWSLQLVQEVARFLQVGDVPAVGEERRLCPSRRGRQSVDEL